MQEPRGTRLTDQVRVDLLEGAWRPGERLQPNKLAERYDTSTTVVREALASLTGSGLVVVVPNRGFFVKSLSAPELTDLTELRCRTEGLAVELAVARGSAAWEAELLTAHYQLQRTQRRDPKDPHHTTTLWAQRHREFHAKIVEASDMPLLIGMAEQLSDATELCRRSSATVSSSDARNVEAEHQGILDAVLERDAALASGLLRSHYERTMRIVLGSGTLRPTRSPIGE